MAPRHETADVESLTVIVFMVNEEDGRCATDCTKHSRNDLGSNTAKSEVRSKCFRKVGGGAELLRQFREGRHSKLAPGFISRTIAWSFRNGKQVARGSRNEHSVSSGSGS